MTLPIWGKIDTLQVHGWQGWLPSIQDQLDIYQRTGQRGRGMQVVGAMAEETEITVTAVYDNASNMTVSIATVEKWKGRTVVVIDNWGRNFPRVRLNRIRAQPMACRGPGPSGGAAVGKVIYTFSMEIMP